MGLMTSYPLHRELCRQMTGIVAEELEHYEQVRDLLERRDIPFARQQAGPYGRRLRGLYRGDEPGRAVDRLIVAALIEARSCERFYQLADRVDDVELATFYRSLFESEARHHTTYLKLAHQFRPEAEVRQRLDELATAEAAILAEGSEWPRMHS